MKRLSGLADVLGVVPGTAFLKKRNGLVKKKEEMYLLSQNSLIFQQKRRRDSLLVYLSLTRHLVVE
jgi:hypothetical protein